MAFDIFSATGEDGILLYFFALAGMTNRRCVDIGAGGVRGSNVANLVVHHGFEALLVDGNARALHEAAAFYRERPETSFWPPVTAAARVTAENVDDLLTRHDFAGPIDLLCIDVDGIDYWIWNSVRVIEPRVVVIEYQDILGPSAPCDGPLPTRLRRQELRGEPRALQLLRRLSFGPLQAGPREGLPPGRLQPRRLECITSSAPRVPPTISCPR